MTEQKPHRNWTLERFQEFCENLPDSWIDLTVRERFGLFCLGVAAAHVLMFLGWILVSLAGMLGI